MKLKRYMATRGDGHRNQLAECLEIGSIAICRETTDNRLHLLYKEDISGLLHEAGYLTASAGQGNQYAQYTLGKLYLLGREVERDRDTAMRWLSLSAAQGNTYAQYFIDHMDDFRGTPAASAVLRMLHHMGSIFRDNSTADGIHVGMQIDKKLRRKMKQKKIAMGHKADDHEQEQKYIMKQ